MLLQQPELPKDKPASETQQYGFELSDFIAENIWYLVILIVIVALVIFDQKRRRKRRK
ncbi:hypothetical protein [Zunongwangia endophytica]|uniref:Uncharacterized protein n=1 Tax=Zunongwangia endophytica TaxID=1808945 RepID=A0ABV8H2Z6_9FLAO|nr:hypothetical protein [Zunongwangia endophytica]MDN3596048.1 hypothetical protein [Zunongwangia endophytica]